MLEHARREYPREACGMLSGRDDRAEEIHIMENADASVCTYRMDPAEQFAVMRTIREREAEMVAIYHSHPDSPAWPSATDLARAFFPDTHIPNYPGIAWVIVGLVSTEPAIRAFLIEEEGTREIEIVSA